MKKIVSIIMVAALALSLSACGSSTSSQSEYKTEIQFADAANYMCAVESDSFSGDVIAAGEYTIESRGNATKPEDTMMVWDIYVSSQEYAKLSELKESELVATVGGAENTGGEFTVDKGQYLYIKYNEVYGTPCGYIVIKHK